MEKDYPYGHPYHQAVEGDEEEFLDDEPDLVDEIEELLGDSDDEKDYD